MLGTRSVLFGPSKYQHLTRVVGVACRFSSGAPVSPKDEARHSAAAAPDCVADVIADLVQLAPPVESEGSGSPQALFKLASRLEACSVEPLTPEQMVSALQALQGRLLIEVPEEKGASAVLTALVQKFQQQPTSLGPGAISSILASLSGASSSLPSVAALTGTLAALTDASHETFSASQTCAALSGLKYCSPSVQGVNDLLAALARQLSASSPDEPLLARDISRALGGLRRCSATCRPVQSIRSYLASRMRDGGGGGVAADGPWQPTDVADALIGLSRSREEDSSSITLLLEALALRISSCEGTFSGKDMSKCLLGLRWCSSMSPAVRAVLSALVPRIEECEDEVMAMSVPTALSGLRRMDAGEPEVRALLAALLPKIDGCVGPLNAVMLAQALGGLARCSSEHAEVRMVLSALAQKSTAAAAGAEAAAAAAVVSGTESFIWTDRGAWILCDIRSALAPLGNARWSSEHAEVRAMLRVLVPLVSAYARTARTSAPYGAMGTREVLELLAGLRHCSAAHAEVRALLRALGRLVDAAVVARGGSPGSSSSSSPAQPPQPLQRLLQLLPPGEASLAAAHSALIGLRGCSTGTAEARELYVALAPLLSAATAAAGDWRGREAPRPPLLPNGLPSNAVTESGRPSHVFGSGQA